NKATDEKLLYQIAIGAMLLSAMDAQKHRLEIENLRDFLLSVQRESGAFNYLHGLFSKNEGDVSQSQYVALALWSIKQTRIEVDNEAMERLTRWFMKVQQNDGGWSYQYPPDQNFPPSHSMAAAGLSGTLVSAESFSAKFKELGGEIVDEQFYQTKDTQFAGPIANTKAKNPD
ncbi:MAG: hypothetical protein ACK53L_05515, partial [Pirellulaceae bacterium]